MRLPVWVLLAASVLLIDAVLVALDGDWRDAARTVLLVGLLIHIMRRERTS